MNPPACSAYAINGSRLRQPHDLSPASVSFHAAAASTDHTPKPQFDKAFESVTRSISTANANASSAAVIAPVWFVKLEFDDGPVCLHTQLGALSFEGDEYTGAGDIGGISQIEEDSELSRSTLTLSLRGLPEDIISILENEHYQGRPATVFLGYLDPPTMRLVDTPLIVYRGRMDAPGTEQGETLSVSLSVESRFAAWDRPLVRRYNDADQQARYPGDRGLEYVEQTTEKQLIWGPG